ncbi:MAG: hypothetical protein QM589_03625 [Thermomicrobiales bacterium]
MPIRHRPVPFARLVPHLLSVAIALMAVVALPLCLPHDAVQSLDADERTVTESRDVVEVVTTPGVHLLHQAANAQVVDACDGCVYGVGGDGSSASHSDEPRMHSDDFGSRFAILPSATGLDGGLPMDRPAQSDPALLAALIAGETPPPRDDIARPMSFDRPG